MKIKKHLPIILFVVGILVAVGVFFLVRSKKSSSLGEEQEVVTEIAFEKRPVVSLTPSNDGHWLKLKIEKIEVNASSLDYELLYKLPDGRTQGVPGSVKIEGKDDLERDLLLGSESSGKFRYDEGVETGTLTIRFRNEKGKLVGKFSTEFSLQSKEIDLASVDGKFKYILDSKPKDGFFVTMATYGVPEKVSGVVSGPYGVFSSVEASLPGKVALDGGTVKAYVANSWRTLDTLKSTNVGIFITTSGD